MPYGGEPPPVLFKVNIDLSIPAKKVPLYTFRVIVSAKRILEGVDTATMVVIIF